MFKNKADTEERAKAFITEIIEKKEVFFFRWPDMPTMFYNCESHDYSYDDETSLTVVPFWSTLYVPYARAYGDGLILDQMGIEEFYYRTLPWLINTEVSMGLNWNQQGMGVEILPITILEQLVINKSLWSSNPEEEKLYTRLKE